MNEDPSQPDASDDESAVPDDDRSTPMWAEPAGPPQPSPGDAPRPGPCCPTCGTPWQPGWQNCPNCAARASATLPPGYYQPPQGYYYPPPGYYMPPPGYGRPRERRPGLGAAIGLYAALLGIMAVTVIIVLANPEVSEATLDLVVISISAVLVLVWMGFVFSRVSGPLRRTGRLWWYPLAIGAAICTFAFTTFYHRPFTDLLGLQEYSYSDMFLREGLGWWVVILSICVQPAVIEELAFRGVILSALDDVMSTRAAIVVSSLMFMVIHLAPVSYPPLLLIGLVLAWIRVKSGSLYPGMVMHFTHNLLVVMSEYLAGRPDTPELLRTLLGL